MNNLLIFGIAFFISLCITPLARHYGNGNGLVDNPNERKVHRIAVPRIGGVAIFLAFFLALYLIYIIHTPYTVDIYINKLLKGLLAGGSIVFILGLYDDIVGIKSWHKFMVQILAAILLYNFGFQINVITHPFGRAIYLGWLSLPVTVLWIVGVSNAINLIDGLDGLAAGVSIMVCFTLVCLSFYTGNPFVAILGLALSGAVLGFIPYNHNPASIFMGDSGSLCLGTNLACMSIWSSQKGPVSISMLVPIIAIGLPILDTFLAMLRRILKGTPIFSADREHCHHKLLARGFTHKQALGILYGLCIFFCIAAISMALSSDMVAVLILAQVVAVVFVFTGILGYFDYLTLKKLKQKLAGKKLAEKLEAQLAMDN